LSLLFNQESVAKRTGKKSYEISGIGAFWIGGALADEPMLSLVGAAVA
jgi:hypothetical protein